MPGNHLGIREPPADLDNVADGALAERADNLGVLSKPKPGNSCVAA
jgi:hypothetical protein